ncbi:MAG: hypothetical protein ACR2JU_05520 [Nocardioidaceae bacterium]
MSGQSLVRAACLGAGLLLAAFGAYSLLRLGVGNLVWSLLWLIGGVIVNDALIAPLALGALALGRRSLPRWARGPVVAGAVVLGSVTLLAVPALGSFGAKPDNPSLLDRSYGVGWLVLTAVVLTGVAAACVVARHQAVAGAPGDRG